MMVNGVVLIMDLPTLDRVHRMGTTAELIKVLRRCPLSEKFGRPAEELHRDLSKGQMIDILAKLILQVQKEPDLEPVGERSPWSEQASVQESELD